MCREESAFWRWLYGAGTKQAWETPIYSMTFHAQLVKVCCDKGNNAKAILDFEMQINCWNERVAWVPCLYSYPFSQVFPTFFTPTPQTKLFSDIAPNKMYNQGLTFKRFERNSNFNM